MRKQYVNLLRDAAKHHGAKVTLEVKASNLGTKKVGETDWWVEPVGGANVDPKYLSAVARVRLLRKTVRNKANAFRNTLQLPHVGGDKYKVRCSKKGTRAGALECEQFQTWRKIYYTVHWMNADCQRLFNRVKGRFQDAFKKAFIELEQASTHKTLVDERRTRSSNALTHLYHRSPPLANKPFHLRIVVVNDLFDVESGDYDELGVSHAVTTIHTDLPLSDITPTHWLRLALARVEPTGAWLNIRGLVKKVSEREISVDVSRNKQLVHALQNGQTLQLRVGTREREHYLGHSIGNFCCVRINETGTRAQVQRTILQTFTHEVGHGFQQVVQRERLHDATGNATGWENNPTWHTDNYGGQGPHCSTNATLIPDPSTPSGQTYAHSAGTLCTMFFSDNSKVDAAGHFCPNCLPRLKRVNLGETQMRAQGWGVY
ncbi:hypothetical protein ATI61_103268 [Archangium gephyra]|uniref:Uncharacterized protein n=1 Tax=Archangium gephyra TaxID=48 RepID=A0AAC8TD76_9BACT|nr:hypothetical protein [Archangium gephyra]AKJ01557.1 Hypothetical protein AA314_03183 [Archangium gephyra]REG34375.1 hypothetical protein ATI61_103268 [Archangium gephyra]